MDNSYRYDYIAFKIIDEGGKKKPKKIVDSIVFETDSPIIAIPNVKSHISTSIKADICDIIITSIKNMYTGETQIYEQQLIMK